MTPRPLLSATPWMLGSLLLHAALLAGLPRDQAGRPDATPIGPIVVTLVDAVEEPADTAGDPLVTPPASPPSQRTGTETQAATEATERHRPTVSDHPPARVPREPVPVAISPVAAAAVEALPARQPEAAAEALPAREPAAAAETAAPPPAEQTSAEGAAAANAGGIDPLLGLLRAEIDQHKRYPRAARRLGREGIAEVDFTLYPDGRVRAVDVTRSSGFRPLDRAARKAVESIAPFAPAARHLTHAAQFRVGVIFELD